MMTATKPQPRIRYAPIQHGRGQNKPHLCDGCGKRFRDRLGAERHWQAEHCPKPKVLTNIECVSVKIEEGRT